MNPKPLAIALLAAMPVLASAQKHVLGVQIGIGHTRIDAPVFRESTLFVPRANSGLTYEFRPGKHLTVGADLLYQRRGAAEHPHLSPDLNEAIADYRYNYLAMPLKLGYRLGGRAFGFARVGLVPALRLRATTVWPSESGGELLFINVTRDVDRFDLGGMAEIGGGYRIGRKLELCASISAQHSFTTFNEYGYFFGMDLRHYGAFANIGLRYGITRKPAPAPAPAGS